MGNEIQEEDICEKQEGWDASDVGKRIPKRVASQGTYFNEMIVEVFCQMCGAVSSVLRLEKLVVSWEDMNHACLGNFK